MDRACATPTIHRGPALFREYGRGGRRPRCPGKKTHGASCSTGRGARARPRLAARRSCRAGPRPATPGALRLELPSRKRRREHGVLLYALHSSTKYYCTLCTLHELGDSRKRADFGGAQNKGLEFSKNKRRTRTHRCPAPMCAVDISRGGHIEPRVRTEANPGWGGSSSSTDSSTSTKLPPG